MDGPRISFCIISRDNEGSIRAMLESIEPLAYEIIVVDTGSVDGTCAIVSEYTPHLYHYTWNDSFSEARNESVRYATGDWIFALDTDEVLPDGSGDLVLKKLREAEAGGVTAYACQIVNMDSGQIIGYSYMQRLFRNHVVERPWYGRIHERLDPRFRTVCVDIPVINFGHDRTQDFAHKDVGYRNWLVERDLQERPDDVDCCLNQIKTCMRERQWAKALSYFSRPVLVGSENKEVLIMQAFILYELGRDAEVMQVLDRYFSAQGRNVLDLRPHLLLGRLLFRQGRHTEAYAQYVRVFVFGPEDLKRQSLGEFEHQLYYSSLFQACYLAVEFKDRERAVRYGHWLLGHRDEHAAKVLAMLLVSAVDAGDHAAVIALYEGYPELLPEKRAYYDEAYAAARAALGRG